MIDNHMISRENGPTKPSLGHRLDEINHKIETVTIALSAADDLHSYLSERLLELVTEKSIIQADYEK